MSESPHNGAPGPDPIDKLYVEAEARLEDAGARAARRERMLAAVARESARSPRRAPRPGARWAGWLAAAGVAGLTIVTVSQTYRPLVRPTVSSPPVARPASSVALGPVATTPLPSTQAVALPKPIPQPRAPAAEAATPERPVERQAQAAAKAAPAPASLESTNRAFPAQAVAPSYSAGHSEEIGGALAPVPSPPPAAAPVLMEKPTADAVSAGSNALGAAAAAGRTGQVDALLARGVPVDATDADGDTPLMKAVRGGHATSAAALRRHGASLDRRNKAGESVRELAAARNDPSIDRALDLSP